MTDTIVVTAPMVSIAAGPRGPAGANGTNGTNGTNGSPGTQGGRLILSGGNLVLVPWNGNQIIINNQGAIIPTNGVSLAPTGVANGVTMYIYAADTDGDGFVDSLQPSGVAPITDPVSGVRSKPAAANRTLVGMARTVSSAWVDSVTQRFVRSWLNRDRCRTSNNPGSNQNYTATTPTEIGTLFRQEALIWADEIWDLSASGYLINSVNLAATWISIMIDGAHQGLSGIACSPATGQSIPFCCTSRANLAEGYHIASVSGFVQAGSQGTIVFDTSATANLKGFVR